MRTFLILLCVVTIIAGYSGCKKDKSSPSAPSYCVSYSFSKKAPGLDGCDYKISYINNHGQTIHLDSTQMASEPFSPGCKHGWSEFLDHKGGTHLYFSVTGPYQDNLFLEIKYGPGRGIFCDKPQRVTDEIGVITGDSITLTVEVDLPL